MDVVGLAYALSFTAVALAWLATRRRPEYLPITLFLTGGLAVDLSRRALRVLVIAPAREALRAQGLDPVAVAFTGWPRIACDIDGALFVAWPAGVAALAIFVFARRRPWGVLVAWAAAVAFMVATFPRGEDLRRVYLACELASLCVSIGCFLLWLFSSRKASLTALSTAMIVAVETALVSGGPFRGNIFVNWMSAQTMLLALYMALIAVQGVILWRSSTSG